MMAPALLLLGAMTAPGLPVDQTKPPVAGTAPVSTETLAVAKRVVVKMHMEEQQRFALVKVAPLFATSVLSLPPEQMPEEIRAEIVVPGGRQRLAAMLADEYRSAFEVRLPQLAAAIAARLARDMSLDDLKAVEAFLDTPAGQKWSGEFTALQQAASEVGARVGEAAGNEAALATIRRLRGQGSGS